MHALSQGTYAEGGGGENRKLQGKRWRKAGGRTRRACGLFSRKSPELDPTTRTLRHLPGHAGASVLVHLEVCRSGPVLPAAHGVHGNGAAERAGALAVQPEAEALLTEHVLRGQQSGPPGCFTGRPRHAHLGPRSWGLSSQQNRQLCPPGACTLVEETTGKMNL